MLKINKMIYKLKLINSFIRIIRILNKINNNNKIEYNC